MAISPDWVTYVQLVLGCAVAAATIYYAWLTKKLWSATNRTAELTQRMLEREDEPLCAISDLTHTLTPDRILTLAFEIKNAGRAPVVNIHLVSEWKGFDTHRPESTSLESEGIGILLPGQSSNHRCGLRIPDLGIKVTGTRGDTVDYEFRVHHIGLCLTFQGRDPSATRKQHILLAEFVANENRLKVHQSFIEEEEGGTRRAYHLLDEVSSVGRGSAPKSFLTDSHLSQL